MKTENILDVIHPNKPGLDEPEMRTLHCPYCKRDLTRVGPPHLAYGEKWGGGAESWQSPLCEASADRFGKSASAFTRVKA